MNYIDLFSGAGGMTLGFHLEGFKNIFSIEYEPAFAETYRRNFPDHDLLVKDIKQLTKTEIKSKISNKSIDVIIGGPPCQGFSMAGGIGRSFIEDERNYLFKEYLRVVKIVKPKMFIMENVARMAHHNNGKTINEVKNSFEEIGYNVQVKILQSFDYSVPQRRQRMFMVGDTGQNFTYPSKSEYGLTVKDAIDDLEKLNSGEKSTIDPNHFAMNHTEQMLKKMSYIQDGGDRYQIPENLRPKTGDVRKYIKYNSKEPSVTVTGDMRKIFHYSQNRALTPRELARLQTFPDDFIFKGKSISIQQQIGNAVPPTLSRAIAKEVKISLSEAKFC